MERQLRQLTQDLQNMKRENYSSKSSAKAEAAPAHDHQLDSKVQALQTRLQAIQDKHNEVEGLIEEIKMDNFNRKSSQEKEIAAIQDQISATASEQADQKEYLD